jgi:phage terminase small subunit
VLPARRQRFVEEYLLDLNATRAAIRAGYSPRTADQQGHRLLTNVEVAAAIAIAQAERSRRTEITADRVLAEYGKLAFANMADYMRATPGGDPYLDFSGLTRDQAAALAEVTVEDYVEGRGDDARQVKRVKFKLGDKLHALDSVARHLGMFKERHEVTGKEGAPLVGDPAKIALVLLSILSRARPAPEDEDLDRGREPAEAEKRSVSR